MCVEAAVMFFVGFLACAALGAGETKAAFREGVELGVMLAHSMDSVIEREQ